MIIATHEPPEIPHSVLPTVRILKLEEPLAIEDAGAVRFVNVLEWAERVARVWRKHGGFGALILNENEDGKERLPPPSFLSFKGTQSTPSSPRSSASLLLPDSPPTRPRSVSARFLPRSRASMMPTVDPSQRPFDHLLNFLPRNTPDKALLKHAILVTTISRPFLVASLPLLPDRYRNAKSPFTSRSSTSVYLSASSALYSGDSLSSLLSVPTKAHILHLLPHESRSSPSFARSKLIQSLEAFLISYAFPPTLKLSSTPGDDTLEPARPYIMDSRTFHESLSNDPGPGPSNSIYVPWPAHYTVGDLVLCGTLDDVQSHTGKTPHNNSTPPRAFIFSHADIVLMSDDTPLPMNVPSSVPSDSPPVSWRQRHYQSTYDTLTASSAGSATGSGLASSSSVSSPHSSPGSPLAPRHSKRESEARYSTYGGLPTPPDSEESGSEVAVVTPSSDLLRSGEKNSRTRIGSFLVTRASVSPVSTLVEKRVGGPRSPHSQQKSNVGVRLRWKFWKGSIWTNK